MTAPARVAIAWLEARARCDLPRLGELTADDAVWDSPVDGLLHGRDAVLNEVRRGFSETDAFSTELLSLDVRDSHAIATVRNTGRNGGAVLDSVQQLHLDIAGTSVTGVRIVVDDPDSVERFWADA